MRINNIGWEDTNIQLRLQEYNIILKVYQMQLDNDDIKNVSKQQRAKKYNQKFVGNVMTMQSLYGCFIGFLWCSMD